MTDVLIVENETATAELIRDYLEMHDLSAEVEANVDAGLAKVLGGDYAMLIFDRDAVSVDAGLYLSKVREEADLPVLVLSASTAEADVIRTLDGGADEYLTKPVRPGEVTARVQALLRFYQRLKGTNAVAAAEIEGRGIVMDGARRRVRVRGRDRKLTRKEFDLLHFMMRHPDEVYTKEQLYREVWGMEAAGGIATVTVHIKKLLDKVEEKPSRPTIITTEWGTGYSFRSEDGDAG